MQINDCGGLILGGGNARRLGGIDKGNLLFDGKSFLQRMEETLAFLPERLYAGKGKSQFVPVYEEYAGCGPLGGIYAGLSCTKCSGLFVAACDTPLMTEAFVRFMIEQAADGLTLSRTADGRMQPLGAVYHRDCLPFIGQMLRDGERRLMGLMERVPVQVISLVGTGFEGVHFNVNTPEDLARLRVLEKLDNSVGFC